MIYKAELEKKIVSSGLFCWETYPSANALGQIRLKEKNLDGLLDFACRNGIKNIFYAYYYGTPEPFLIDIEEYDLEKEEIRLIEKDVKLHNKQINALNFDQPMFLEVYCLYEGHNCMVEISNEWFDKLNLMPADEMLRTLLLQHDIDLAERRHSYGAEFLDEDDDLDELDALMEKMMLDILADHRFHACKNAALRKQYAERFMQDNPQYAVAFPNRRGGGYNKQDVQDFINFIWQGLKSIK